MIDKDNIITNLIKDHCWLAQDRFRLKGLIYLFDQCQDDYEVYLTKELIEKFTYFDHKQRDFLINQLAHYIASHYTEESVIFAMTKGDGTDSGQSVIVQLRVPLAILCQTFDDNNPLYSPKNNFNYIENPPVEFKPKSIFIVDEFCGSGRTIRNRIKFIREKLPSVESIYFCILAGMEYTYESLKSEFPDVNFYFVRLLKRGIMDSVDSDLQKIDKTCSMLRMEDYLSKKSGRGKDKNKFKNYSLGFGNAQSLIYFEGCNIPNSVFPWFWWKYNSDYSERDRMFVRFENGL